MEKIEFLVESIKKLLDGDFVVAQEIIKNNYPFENQKIFKRQYSDMQKMEIFCRDGFVDLYSGKKLLNPAILRVLSHYFPDVFPYHPHWKMSECHIAYWKYLPTVDHVCPIARGGVDEKENWVTTSMLHNSIKSNWTLEELSWQLHKAGSLDDLDGMSKAFLQLVENDSTLLMDKYINHWYKITKQFFKK